ncbi:MAG: LysR family transcriptional regulator [Pseudohongiellaceae bacterium]|jgi:LysR family hydrogen peroxide-inducible transcriptional activator
MKNPMQAKRPTIRQLEYFVAVARASNFRRAAQKLGVTQPNLTQQIAELEEMLGVQLFDRSRAGTLLTPTGRAMLPLAREIIEQYEQLADFSDTDKDPDLAGSFRLGVSPTVSPTVLPQVFPVLHARFPDLKLQVRQDASAELERGLDAGEFDLILTVLPVQTGRHRIRPLYQERVVVVMHKEHPLARKPSLKGRDLHQHGIIGLSQHMSVQRQIQFLCDRYGAQLLQDVEANSLSGLHLMVQLNMGIAILPELFVHSMMQHDASVRSLHIEDEALTRTHVAVWRKQASARHHFQKLSFEIKAMALDCFGDVLQEVQTDEHLPETW